MTSAAASTGEPPLLTVITVCLNRADTIVAAIDSVVRQQARDLEHLVIDGASTDGTLEILARYPSVRVESAPDKGLYDAMNKGVRAARGRYVVFLNSDDELADGVVDAVRPGMLAGCDAVCVGTDVQRFDGQARRVVVETLVEPETIALTPTSVALGSPLLNAKFLRRSFLMEHVGEFDLRYRLASDVDLLLRAALARPTLAVLPIVGHHYMQHTGSLTIDPDDKNGRRAAEECLAIADAMLQRSDLPARVRFCLRALRGGKLFAIANFDRRHGGSRRSWGSAAAGWPDVMRYGWYLVDRKLKSPQQRYDAEMASLAAPRRPA